MKTRVDPDVCIGDEICTQTYLEIFQMKGDKVVDKIKQVPENLKECVREAASSCPTKAIIIEE